MSHDAFISFSSKDADAADKIRHGLETRGISCWMSSRDVPAGADFGEAIVDALEKALVMVLVFSVNANNSPEVKKELVLAGEYKMPVLPVRIENVLPSGAFRYQLTIRQYLDLFEDWDTNMAKLADQIAQIIKSLADRSADVPRPDSDSTAIELSFWESIKDSQHPEEFEAYLEQFPHGRFVILARRRMEAIKQGMEVNAIGTSKSEPLPTSPEVIQPPQRKSAPSEPDDVKNVTHRTDADPSSPGKNVVNINVPDIGDIREVKVIELLVNEGETVKVGQSLITVESHDFNMEIPSPQAGVVAELKVKTGDRIREGSLILTLQTPTTKSRGIALFAGLIVFPIVVIIIALNKQPAVVAATDPFSQAIAVPTENSSSATSISSKPAPAIGKLERIRPQKPEVLSTDNKERLDKFFDEISNSISGGMVLEVVIDLGHADTSNIASVDQSLSERRAELVKDYLVSKGMESDRIHAEGVGHTQPLAARTSKMGIAENNHVELEVIGTDKMTDPPKKISIKKRIYF